MVPEESQENGGEGKGERMEGVRKEGGEQLEDNEGEMVQRDLRDSRMCGGGWRAEGFW